MFSTLMAFLIFFSKSGFCQQTTIKLETLPSRQKRQSQLQQTTCLCNSYLHFKGKQGLTFHMNLLLADNPHNISGTVLTRFENVICCKIKLMLYSLSCVVRVILCPSPPSHEQTKNLIHYLVIFSVKYQFSPNLAGFPDILN